MSSFLKDERIRAIVASLLVLVALGLFIRTKINDQIVDYDDVEMVYSTSDVTQFNSLEEFKAYLAEASSLNYGQNIGLQTFSTQAMDDRQMVESDMMNAIGAAPKATTPDRVSQTNVQVAGIDEPDILKTDGTSIYYTTEPQYPYYYRDEPVFEEPILLDTAPEIQLDKTDAVSSSESDVDSMLIEKTSIMPPLETSAKTRILTAFPPENLAEIGVLDYGGELLLVDGRLLVLNSGSEWDDRDIASVRAFDVSDGSDPTELWDIQLDSQHVLEASRLIGDSVYLIYRRNVDYSTPCPIPLFDDQVIACGDIYHPKRATAVDTTYTVLKLDTKTGEKLAETTFLGSTNNVVYMSAEALYITYSYTEDIATLLLDEFVQADDLFSSDLRADMRRVNGYDLSSEAKQLELNSLLEKWLRTLDADESKRVENEMANRSEKFFTEHKRDLESTDIMRFTLRDLDLVAVGTVPGVPLNQFALDQYGDNLRVAVTIGENSIGRSDSVNDVYVLNEALDTVGSIEDMGKGERIYAVRFIEDQGYVVTYRQTDPFYVLDLADPDHPQLSGELKIPGYSSYLHPLTPDLILGIGQEDWRVKLSIFDVSDASKPTEQDHYSLDAYWTEIQDNHHGFLLDAKNEIFFFPADQEGYIFSYGSGKITLEKVVTGQRAKRALFIDNLLYVVGESGVTVLDESDWSTVKIIAFN